MRDKGDERDTTSGRIATPTLRECLDPGPNDGTASRGGMGSGGEADRPADPSLPGGGPSGDVGDLQPKSAGDGGQHLGGGFLQATLDLGEVLRGHPGASGDVDQAIVPV